MGALRIYSDLVCKGISFDCRVQACGPHRTCCFRMVFSVHVRGIYAESSSFCMAQIGL